jgi:hypothetical protein
MTISTSISYIVLIIFLIAIVVLFTFFLITVKNARQKYVVNGYSQTSKTRCIAGLMLAGLFVVFMIVLGACMSFRH